MQQPQWSVRFAASRTEGEGAESTHLLPPPSLTLFPNRMLRPANRPRRARPHMVAAFWPDMAGAGGRASKCQRGVCVPSGERATLCAAMCPQQHLPKR
jgi:hypothetical protein